MNEIVLRVPWFNNIIWIFVCSLINFNYLFDTMIKFDLKGVKEVEGIRKYKQIWDTKFGPLYPKNGDLLPPNSETVSDNLKQTLLPIFTKTWKIYYIQKSNSEIKMGIHTNNSKL